LRENAEVGHKTDLVAAFAPVSFQTFQDAIDLDWSCPSPLSAARRKPGLERFHILSLFVIPSTS
jgi:hypothetical protein